MLATGSDAVLGLRFDEGDSTIVIVNNLSPERQSISLDLDHAGLAEMTDLLSDRRYEPINPATGRTRINGYGYRWLRLGGIY